MGRGKGGGGRTRKKSNCVLTRQSQSSERRRSSFKLQSVRFLHPFSTTTTKHTHTHTHTFVHDTPHGYCSIMQRAARAGLRVLLFHRAVFHNLKQDEYNAGVRRERCCFFFFFNASLYYLHLFCAIVNHSPKKKKVKHFGAVYGYQRLHKDTYALIHIGNKEENNKQQQKTKRHAAALDGDLSNRGPYNNNNNNNRVSACQWLLGGWYYALQLLLERQRSPHFEAVLFGGLRANVEVLRMLQKENGRPHRRVFHAAHLHLFRDRQL